MNAKERKAWEEMQFAVAMEWGYKACENGLNIQLAKERFAKLLTGEISSSEALKAPQATISSKKNLVLEAQKQNT